MAFRPEAAKALNELVDVLLRETATLTPAERELIATFVSARNHCAYCQAIHGAIASCHLGGDEGLVTGVKRDYASAPVSDKLKALLAIADQVRQGGKHVTAEAVAEARRQGAGDQDIHDTVLIAAAFCMFNRYVDGLATVAPQDPAFYRDRAGKIVQDGYSAVNREFQASRQT